MFGPLVGAGVLFDELPPAEVLVFGAASVGAKVTAVIGVGVSVIGVADATLIVTVVPKVTFDPAFII